MGQGRNDEILMIIWIMLHYSEDCGYSWLDLSLSVLMAIFQVNLD